MSPYAYCNNNPVNLVDLSGADWYRHCSTGEIVWFPGDNPHDTYENLGPTYEESGMYYSLFGAIVSEHDKDNNPIGALYRAIDHFVSNYIKSIDYIPTSLFDQDFPSSATTFDIAGQPFSFVYERKNFQSEKDGTIFRPINRTSWRGNQYEGDNVLVMRFFPSGKPFAYGGYSTSRGDKRWTGYWLVGESRTTAGHPLQIRFDEQNAMRFLQDVNLQLRRK